MEKIKADGYELRNWEESGKNRRREKENQAGRDREGCQSAGTVNCG